jgi:chorismate mutase / prephenate dehydratase
MSANEVLKDLREQIDRLDGELLQLLNARMEVAKKVGELKADKGLNLFDPSREETIFERLNKLNKGPISESSLRAVYREIFAASRLLQYVLQVAYLGPEWTTCYLAAHSFFGHSARYLPAPTLEDVFDSLDKGGAHVAVVPIENSFQGGIGVTIDLLYEHEFLIVRECYLEIAHYLCGHGTSIEDVKRIYAQPQAMEQCRQWFLENLRDREVYQCTSNARAAQLASQDPSGAAISNLFAARHYGLNILADHIEEQAGNTTRFIVLGRDGCTPTGNDKTSLLFAVSDEPGALHGALEAFALSRVNMTRIESRPNRQFPWQFLFFADVEGHLEDEAMQTALGQLKSRVTFLKVLGSYPRSDPKFPIRLDKERTR